jgi:hypothetical protein
MRARNLLLLSLLSSTLGLSTAFAAPRGPVAALAGVAILETAQQSAEQLQEVRALLEGELAKRGIKAASVPPRLAARSKALVAYAKAKKLRRVYELRLTAEGEGLVASLVEKRGRKLKSAFRAQLPVPDGKQLGAAIPRLVEAVIAQREPQPLPVASVAPAATASEASATASAGAAAAGAPAASVSALAPERESEFLFGISVEPVTFFRAPGAVFGGSAMLLYQRGNWRGGASLTAGGGQGRVLQLGARLQRVFREGTTLRPFLGASLSYVQLKNADNAESNGGAVGVSAGLQYRRPSLRFTFESELLLPWFPMVRDEQVFKNGILDLVRHSAYSPALIFKLGCLI